MASPNRRPGYSRRAQYGFFLGYVIAGAGVLTAAILVALSVLDPPAFAVLRAAVAEITTPISSAADGIGRGLGSVPGAIGDHFAVMGENRALRKQIQDDHALVLRARTILQENGRLKRLLAVRERGASPVAVARLVSSSASSTRRYAMLNAGSFQGVGVGMPVRGAYGLVGRILEAGPDSARVLLLTDPESVVPVRRVRDGLPALAAGRGDGGIEIRGASAGDAGLKPGDVFVTSGTGGIYPPDVPVARVAEVGRDTALAFPFSQPDALDFALVQKPFFPMPAPTPGKPAAP